MGFVEVVTQALCSDSCSGLFRVIQSQSVSYLLIAFSLFPSPCPINRHLTPIPFSLSHSISSSSPFTVLSLTSAFCSCLPCPPSRKFVSFYLIRHTSSSYLHIPFVLSPTSLLLLIILQHVLSLPFFSSPPRHFNPRLHSLLYIHFLFTSHSMLFYSPSLLLHSASTPQTPPSYSSRHRPFSNSFPPRLFSPFLLQLFFFHLPVNNLRVNKRNPTMGNAITRTNTEEKKKGGTI